MDFSFFKNMFAGKEDASPKAQEAKPADSEKDAAESALAENLMADVEDERLDENAGLSETKHRSGRRQRRQNGRRRDKHSQEDGVSDAPSLSGEEVQEVLSKLEEFVAFSAKSLVDSPELVSTKVVEREGSKLILVSCDKKDTGKIIGRSGKIIAAIRILISGAASRYGIKATVDIDE